ncbi:DUF1641 domain-containing protein [Pandoraea pulmonicola]|uniref:DUF1641 domain-containing protein n=2 Tax=Pandoraea pulmonicola TaxID=93221 RepID=A0AAJ4ZEM6_PANPU|nr:DUF1641 domain-containing protein [Pandoraea pulmonicola]SUA91947.1 Uncharacterised protein [Pandoraea pulmonicola]
MKTPDTNTPVVQGGDNMPEGQASRIAALLNESTERGLVSLVEKLAPLIQGNRLHNVVDLLSLVSDAIDMFDDAMIQKLMNAFESGIGTFWSLTNAARYAQNAAENSATPSAIELQRVAGQEDVRRGLHFSLLFLAVLGRQMRKDADD